MLDAVQRVAEMQDHAERLRAASVLLAELQAAVTETARLRRESIAYLRDHGHSLATIADIIGVSRARIAQLKTAGPPPERAFLGTDRLTIAVTVKADSATGRPVVAHEDFRAAQAFAELATDLQLGSTFEYVNEGREDFNLNRDNLVVICGPRISPAVRAAYDRDPAFEWHEDEAGRWELIDTRANDTYTSPSDKEDAEPADIAYLGRLSRPDGRGAFLIVGGVHSVGSFGAAHYVSRNLTDLYELAGTQRFSTVIGSTYEPATRDITASYRIGRLHLHETS